MIKDPSLVFKYAALPDEAQSNWELFCEAYRQKKGRTFDSGKTNVSLFLKIFGNSRFLSSFVHRHPLFIDEILDSSYIDQRKPIRLFSAEIASFSQPDTAEWLNQIRIYKYKELLRITLKDFFGNRDEDVLTELSFLAYTILNALDQRLLMAPGNKGDIPLNEDGQICTHAIMAMGKMGGCELNYSSDIDLIALYETDDVRETNFSPQEFYVRHIQSLTAALQNRTEEGFLYRVDWDLRPEGKAGVLISSLSSMEAYYETFGAEWERQAMTKVSPAAGSPLLGREFIGMITPFVYRKFLDVESIRQIQNMAERIHEDQTQKKTRGFNVKLGVGGIREIEFFVQSFLLIYGGKKPELRHANTLEVLSRLEANRLVHTRDAFFLKEAYLFLRKVEHRLQLEEEAQTHTVPFEEKLQVRTARRMGYLQESDTEAHSRFMDDLKKYTEGVHRIFSNLFTENVFYVPTSSQAKREEYSPDIYQIPLAEKIKQAGDFEEKLDVLRRFKKEEQKKIGECENNPAITRYEILLKLSVLAEAICRQALEFTTNELKSHYGLPYYSLPQGGTQESQLIVMGMGKLGGQEINYASDLDVIYIYSENGETSGPEKISNAEYFARLVQKFISILSVPTQLGVAYQIDADLRPSGNYGPLVTSLESFVDYQREASQIWERQALLRARPIAGSAHLARLISGHIKALLFSTPYPDKIIHEMHRLRTRVEKEIAKEGNQIIDLKLGRGGLMDVEFVLQSQQLLHASVHEDFRQNNTFAGLDKLIELNFLPRDTDAVALKEIYTFYRTLESKIALVKQRSLHRIDLKDTLLDEIIPLLQNSPSRQEVVEQILESRERVRKIYDSVFVP